MVQAAALPLVSITAYEALFDRLGIQRGQKLLVQGGAGGVGHIAVQLARAAGVEVFATDNGEASLAAIERLGATPIDYKTSEVADIVARYTDGQGFDAVFDTVGGDNLPRSFKAVKLRGQVATTVTIGEVDLTQAHLHGATLHVIYMLIPLIHGVGQARHGEILADVASQVDTGDIAPIVDSIFPFAQTADAHRKLESGSTVGKVVVQFSS